MGGRKTKPQKHEEIYNDDPFAWFVSILGLIVSIGLILISYTRGDVCKMRDVDVSGWEDPNKKGQIPSWMILEGIIIGIGSLFYILGRAIRTSIRPVGLILTGLCGKMTMFLIWIFGLVVTGLGQVWIYLANLHRTEDNASREGDPNYCAPEVWYTTQVVVYLYWILTALGLFLVLGEIYLFFQGPEFTLKKVVHLQASQNPSTLDNRQTI